MGSFEVYNSIINYRNRVDYYCIPELDNEYDMEVTDVYHPLLDNPVSNSIKVEKKGVLITGSNASGKSTFLRTIGINALLSQSINTSLSKSYRGKFYKIMSSMTIKDDLLKGDSYYMAEIKSIRRLLDKVAMDYNVLCFVDEVLKGTNTVERIAGGYEILLSLSRGKSLCFAATHDIELTSLLENTYQNMHFEDKGAFTGEISAKMLYESGVEYVIIGVIGAAAGSALSYVFFPAMEHGFIREVSGGIIWKERLYPVVTFGVLAGVTLFMMGAAYSSTRKIKKLHPATALRFGLKSNSFKKNHLPLSETKGELNFLLAMKSSLQNMGQNITIFFIVTAVDDTGRFSRHLSLSRRHFL